MGEGARRGRNVDSGENESWRLRRRGWSGESNGKMIERPPLNVDAGLLDHGHVQEEEERQSVDHAPHGTRGLLALQEPTFVERSWRILCSKISERTWRLGRT